jgi:uncharacterized membrane protein
VPLVKQNLAITMATDTANLPSMPSVRRPIHSLVAHFSAACLVGALFTDITYWRTAEMMWADFSAWLVTVGVVLGAVAVVAGLFDLFTGRLRGLGQPGKLRIVGYLLALVVSIFNAMIHTHDAWTSVVPWGLTLSAIVTIILVFVGVMGRREQYSSQLEVID